MRREQGGEGWIGVDLDGTLAEYNGWVGPTHIGPPIPKMVDRVKAWLAEGKTVKVFTARVCPNDWGRGDEEVREIKEAIGDWTREHIGAGLRATCVKDFHMIELWDDRAKQVEFNTGVSADERYRELLILACKT